MVNRVLCGLLSERKYLENEMASITCFFFLFEDIFALKQTV